MGKIFDNLAAQTKQQGQKNLEQQLMAREAEERAAASSRDNGKSNGKGGRPVQTPGLKSRTVQFTNEEWGPIAKKARVRAAKCGFQVPSNASLVRAALRAFVLVEDEAGLKAAMRQVETIEELELVEDAASE